MQAVFVSEELVVTNTLTTLTPLSFQRQKIVNDEIIFVPNEGTKAQHTQTYVSISLSEVRCKKNSSERFLKFVESSHKYIIRLVS